MKFNVLFSLAFPHSIEYFIFNLVKYLYIPTHKYSLFVYNITPIRFWSFDLMIESYMILNTVFSLLTALRGAAISKKGSQIIKELHCKVTWSEDDNEILQTPSGGCWLKIQNYRQNCVLPPGEFDTYYNTTERLYL